VGDRGENLEQAQVYPEVEEFLQSSKDTKILVTKELVPGLQQKKIDHLGIKKWFDEIIICSSDQEKKDYFQKIKEKYVGRQIWVIGDRITSEIRWGNKLGLKTIQIYLGKYKDLKPKDDLEIPQYKVTTFEEIESIITCKP